MNNSPALSAAGGENKANYGLTKENLLRTFPIALQNDPSVMALAEAAAELLAKRPTEIKRLLLYPAIDQLDEKLLDILAYDFKVDWWDAGYSLEEKRRTLKDSWRVHKLLGTKAAVETAISAIYPGTTVQEWFEYGGEPYHFKLTIDLTGDAWDPEKQKRVLAKLNFYKNLRSHSDGVFYFTNIDPIRFRLEQNLQFLSLQIPLRIPNTDRKIIRLDGQKQLDGSWYLDQAVQGVVFVEAGIALCILEQERVSGAVQLICPPVQTRTNAKLVQASACLAASNPARAAMRSVSAGTYCRQSYGLSGTLTRDCMWRLNGQQMLDGSRKLNASIVKEEI